VLQADKSAALTALEERSREFMREKAEKRKLEQRLHSMSSQLLMGGNAPAGACHPDHHHASWHQGAVVTAGQRPTGLHITFSLVKKEKVGN
jgi:hypothetical protein